MAVILRLLFIVLLITVFRHLLGNILGTKPRIRRTESRAQQRPGFPQRETGHMVRDPLCGTFVAEELSVSAKTGGETLHFCSRECRDTYLASLTRPAQSQPR